MPFWVRITVSKEIAICNESDAEISLKEKAKIQMFLEMQSGLKELQHTTAKLHELSHPKKK